MKDSKIIVALDYSTLDEVTGFVDKIEPEYCKLKVGKQLFTSCGPAAVELLVNRGYDIFLDLKFHDIPNTVEKACKAAANMGVWMLNVHAIGGREMMLAAREAISGYANRPLLVAVTVLTSISDADLEDAGITLSTAQMVMNLARTAQSSGLDGVVCSPQETRELRKETGDYFCLVTPGIRPEGANADDQARIQTPYNAIRSGSDYLVIGRPVTQARQPLSALQKIIDQIRQAID